MKTGCESCSEQWWRQASTVLVGGTLALTSRLLRPSATRFLPKPEGTNG